MPGSVIVAGARTPIGKLSGALASFSAMELGGFAITAALTRASVAPEDVDYVFMGHVLQAGQGQITARQAAHNAGIPMTVPATTVNKVCLSGLNALYLADQMITSGDAEALAGATLDAPNEKRSSGSTRPTRRSPPCSIVPTRSAQRCYTTRARTPSAYGSRPM